MKLIVITGAIHFDENIKQILEKCEVPIYSRSNISGHKKKGDTDLSENWFAGENAYQESVIFFAFTEKERVEKIMETVNKFNETLSSESPVRAFVLAVENHN